MENEAKRGPGLQANKWKNQDSNSSLVDCKVKVPSHTIAWYGD